MKPLQNRHSQRAVIEELEPRLLFTADFATILSDPATQYAEARTLGNDGEFTRVADDQQAVQHARFEVVFIDLRVEGFEQILADIQTQNNDGRSIEVVLLDMQRDGVSQIGEFLNLRQNVDAIHLISHGSAGSVSIGSGQLDFDTLVKNAASIKQWGNALSDEADILIYGCDLAASEEGQSLIGALSRLTGADVAASDDKTGAAKLGGNYDLEYAIGTIESKVVFSTATQQNWAYVLATPIARSDAASTTENGVLTVSAPGVLANDTNPDAATLTTGATLNFTTDGDGVWTNQTATTGFDWTITNFGTQSTYTTAPTTAYPGITSAYQFSGTNSGASMPSFEGLPGDPTNNSASFEIWFRTDVLTATSGQHIVFETGGVNSGTSLYLDNTFLKFATRTGGATADEVSVDLAALYASPTTEFIQVIGVIDQTSGQMKLYIDGNLRATKSLTGANGSDWNGPDGAGLGRVFTDVSSGPTAGSGTLDGDIAIFRLYEKALSAAEAATNFTAVAGSSAGLFVKQVQGSVGNVGNQIALASGALLTMNANGSYTYNPNNQFKYLGAGQSTTDSFSYTVANASGSTATTTVTITVNGNNDAPVATNLNAAETYTEDTPFNLADIVVSDADSANVTVTLTLSNTVAGSLNTGTSGAVTSTYNAGTGVWTASGATADVNALLAGLTFTPTANFNSDFTIATSVSDGSLSVTGGKAMTGIPVNDAPTFGVGDGAVTTDFGAGDIAYAVAVQADGKILLAGSASVGGNDDFALTRYNIDGSLDTSFGIGGKVTTAIGGGTDWAHGVVVQADGKIVVAGRAHNGTNYDVAVVRYNADGTLDSSFGGGTGKVTVDFGSGNDVGNMLALQADGKIVVSARARIGATDDFAVLRFNTDGTLDTSFGGTGKVTTAIGPGNESGQRLTIQADGKIVVSGYSSNGTNNDFALVRYNTNGTLDTSFGGTGIITTAIGAGNDSGSGVAVQADGKIVVAGASSNGSNDDFAIVRYYADGTLDTSFGGTGIVTTAIGTSNDQGHGLRLQADGKIIVGGFAIIGGTSDFAVVRYNTDGTLDTSFGSGGSTTVSIGSGNDVALEMALQDDGQILLAGRSSNGSNDDFAVVRIGTNGMPDSSFDQRILNGRPTYIENGTAVVLDNDVQIFDAELAAANNYAGATLMLSRNGGASSQDTFSATGNLSPLTQGGILTLSGMAIGTVTTNSAGTLVLTFNSNATQANINQALQSIAYMNSSDTPPASAQINWVFNDGNTGSQGSGGALSTLGSTTVNITAVNDAPTASNLNAAETYTEDTPLNLTDIVVSDVDSATVTVTLTLSYTAAGSLNTDTSGAVTSTFVNGVWSASGAIADVNALLAALTFTPTPDFNASFTLATSVSDGSLSISGSKAFTGVATNDAPTNLSAGVALNGDAGNDAYLVDNTSGVPYWQGFTGITMEFTISDLQVPATMATLYSRMSSGSGSYLAILADGTLSWNGFNSTGKFTQLFDGDVHTVAFTWSPPTGSLNYYVDGVLVGTRTTSTQATTIGGGVFTLGQKQNSIGGGFIASQAFSGTFHDVRVWNHVRTSAAISSESGYKLDLSPSIAASRGLVANWQFDGLGAGKVMDTTNGYALTIGHASGTGYITSTPTDIPSVAENSVNGTYVGYIVAADKDSGETHTYSLTDTAGGRFAINATTGQITVANGSLLDYESATSHVITVRTVDSGGLAYEEFLTVRITNVNDAPTATNLNAAETYTENTPLDLTDIVVSDVDSANVTVTLTLSNIAAGSLNTGTSGSVTSTFSGGIWSASGAIADVNALLAALTFTPTANFNTSFSIATSVSDGSLSVTGSKAFTGIAVNDAPTLGNGTLASVAEDTLNPPGQTVNTIFTGQFNDVDAGSSFGGVAVVGNTAIAGTQGTWQYSTNGGSNWFAIGSVNDGTTALALSSSTLIRFMPVANYNGTPPALGVRGLDNTYVAGYSSTAGTESRVNVNTASNGGSTAIAAVTATLSTSITAVVDTPSVTNATTDENTQSTSGLVLSRNASDGAEVTHFKITGITNGTLYQNDGVTPIVDGDFITFAEGNAGLKFSPTANFYGSGSFTVQASTSNVDAGLGGSTVNATITVNAVDDPAIISGDISYSGNEGDAVSGTMTATDVDGLTDGTYFSVTSAASFGTAATNADNGAWIFTPTDSNWFGSDSFVVTVTDDLGGTTTQVVNITLANVDDPAVITGDISYSGLEGDSVVGDLNATDVDGLTDGTIFSVTAPATNGTAAINAATGAWTFTPTDANWFGSDSFTVTVTDDLGGTTTQLVSITLANVDDPADMGGDISYSGNEGDAVSGTMTATDVDGLTDGTYFSVTSAASFGTAAINTASGVWTYIPTDSAWFGADSFMVTVTDDLGGTTFQQVSITLADTTSVPVSMDPPAPSPPPVAIEPDKPADDNLPTITQPDSATESTDIPLTTASPAVENEQAARGAQGAYAADRQARDYGFFHDEPLSHQEPTHLETREEILLRLLEILHSENTSGSTSQNTYTPTIQVDITEDESFRMDVFREGPKITAISLSVGAVWWALRVGGIFASLVTSLPAWRSFDVLPVLGRNDDEDEAEWESAPDPDKTQSASSAPAQQVTR